MSEELQQAIALVNRILEVGSIKMNGEALTRADHVAISNAFAKILEACRPDPKPESNGNGAPNEKALKPA